MPTVHAFLSLRRQAITAAQRNNIAARGITWDVYPFRVVAGVQRVGMGLEGPRDQIILLRDWLIQEGFAPIICGVFTDRSGQWRRMTGVPVNRAAWNAVAPARPRATGALEFPAANDPIIPQEGWPLGYPLPSEDEEDPE